MDNLCFILSVAAVPVLVVLVLWSAARQRTARAAGWAQFTKDTGIATNGTWPAISFHAERDGVAVSFRQTVSTGDRTPGVEFGTLIARPNVDLTDIRVLPQVPGGADVPIGSAEFQTQFRVRTDDPARASAILNPRAQRAMLDGILLCPTFAVGEKGVVTTHAGMADPDVVARELDVLVAIAKALDEPAS